VSVVDSSIMASVLSELFPYGWIDGIMWATVPLWVWTLWVPYKPAMYWILSMVVCIAWAGFGAYIKSYPGVTLNLICLVVLILGYRRFRRGKRTING
jgi:hypothetical protein